jgi:hypothetical protein
MPITVRIEGEDGSAREAPWCHTRSTELLAGEHPGSCCLRFIDPYGDAVFNQSQLPVLLDELRALRGGLADPALIVLVDELLRYLNRAVETPHTYVRFVGD